MNKNKQYYDEFFVKYGPDAHLDPGRFLKIASLCKGNVLDIGCGTGHLADFYNGQYHGIDISSVAIDYAKKLRRQNADFSCIDAVNFLPFGFRKFDTIVLAEFLEHIKNDDSIFFALKKMLKPNGRIIVSVPNGDRVPDESHLRTFTVPELRKKFSPLGVVKFHNWFGFNKRILMTCDLGQKSETSLSLAMIVKNEGLGIENAVLSCIDFVDNIVISVDKQSQDNTFEIAKLYSDILQTHEWQNDFSKARNDLTVFCQTDWLLWVDGHEYIKKMPDLAVALKRPQDGYFVKVNLENDFSFFFPRLIRKEVLWENSVHNSPKVKDPKRIDSLIIVHDRANLQSKLSAGIRDKQRDFMLLNIMRAEIKKDKKNPRPYFYLGQHFCYCKKFGPAIKYYKKYLKYSKDKQERWLVWWEIGKVYFYKEQFLRALFSFRSAEKEMPGRWETALYLGITWALSGEVNTSLKCFLSALEHKTFESIYNPLEFDSAMIYDYIAAGLQSKGSVDEAKAIWQKYVEIESKKPPEIQNKNRLEFLKKYLSQ